LIEENILIERVNPARFFGPNDGTLKYIRTKFPELNIASRGNEIKVTGSQDSISDFQKKLEAMLTHLENNSKMLHSDIDLIVNGEKASSAIKNTKVLVYGPDGKVIKARTSNQLKMVEYIHSNDILFALGPAGTGKTYTAVALAVKALKDKEVKKIILARPAVEAGESLGFLPGDMKDKIDPYLKPLYDSLQDMIPAEKYSYYLEKGTIEIAPMAFMRGRTLDDCFIILDEAQNATDMQIKMFLTRMGPNAKIIVTGDMSQIDLPRNQNSGLKRALRILQDVPGIKFIHLDTSDVLRHRLVKDIIKAYRDNQELEQNSEKKNAKRPPDKTSI
jgi:phosphate starvation-inducible protein PhoH and related proteins